MLICIDSCVFIRGTSQAQADARRLLDLIGPELRVVIHRQIVLEVARNLDKREDLKLFFSLFHENAAAHIVDGPIPQSLVDRYIVLGLAEKGDAYIGAFAEWMRVDYLISDNRHFLRDLRTDAYKLLSPGDFLDILRQS
jgi:hypothetical protein